MRVQPIPAPIPTPPPMYEPGLGVDTYALDPETIVDHPDYEYKDNFEEDNFEEGNFDEGNFDEGNFEAFEDDNRESYVYQSDERYPQEYK